MPLFFSDILKQQNRAANVTGPAFFFLVDSADVNFRVEGIVDSTNLKWDQAVKTSQRVKYVIIDTSTTAFDASGGLPVGIGPGDVIVRKVGGWELLVDVSNETTTQSDKTRGGTVVYNAYDGKLYYRDGSANEWKIVGSGEGNLTGAAGPSWAVQYRAPDGTLSGDAGFLFNNTDNQVVLGDNVVIRFSDGTTQGTARNFYGTTGPTTNNFPAGFSGAGNTGDRLLVATGPSGDPFRNYVKFGNQWFQYGVAGVAQGPRGLKGDNGVDGVTGATGATGKTGSGLTALSVNSSSGILSASYIFDGILSDPFDIGYVRGNTGFTGPTGATGKTGSGLTGLRVDSTGTLFAKYRFDGSDSAEFEIGYVRGNTGFTGATGATGKTGSGLTALSVNSSGTLMASYLFDGIQSSQFEIGYVRGNTGFTGATGATGKTGSGLTAVTYNQSTGILSASYIFDGILSDPFDIGYVRGNTGFAGATGATGKTGSGITGVEFNETTGQLSFQYFFDGNTTSRINIGYARGGTGFTGATGATGPLRGPAYKYVNTGQNGINYFSLNEPGSIGINPAGNELYIHRYGLGSTVNYSKWIKSWDDSDSDGFKGYVHINRQDAQGTNTPIIFGILGGVTGYGSDEWFYVYGDIVGGGTGSIANNITCVVAFDKSGSKGLIDLPLNTGLTNNDRTIDTSISAGTKARKVLFLLDDGTLTADYILNYNIFGAGDFLFQHKTFTATPASSPNSSTARYVQLSNSNYNFAGSAGVTFTTTYIGTPVTANVQILSPSTYAASGSPTRIWFPTSGMTSILGSDNATFALTGAPAGAGARPSTSFRMEVTGTYIDTTPTYSTKDVSITYWNHFLWGIATGPSVGPNDLDSGTFWNRVTATNASVRGQNVDDFSFTNWNATASPAYYVYFAYPARIQPNEATQEVKFFANAAQSAPQAWTLQGYGLASDANGVSNVDYTNALGYKETYKVWRTEQAGLGLGSTYINVEAK